jgi:hypothetical protein
MSRSSSITKMVAMISPPLKRKRPFSRLHWLVQSVEGIRKMNTSKLCGMMPKAEHG